MKSRFLLILCCVILGNNISAQVKQFRNNLYIVDPNGNAVLMDGTLNLYSDDYSNDVDRLDARKMENPGENMGILRDDKVLIIERRKNISVSDTIFYKFWNSREISYRLELLLKNFEGSGLKVFLYDNYLNTKTALSLTEDNFYNFSVSADSDSKRMDRFMVVFNPFEVEASVMPLDFISTTATAKSGTVSILWKTANEHQVHNYTIERSSDGIDFIQTGITVNAGNQSNNQYAAEDPAPIYGTGYYRIVAHDADGKVTLSKVLKVSLVNSRAAVSVFPNPAVSSNIRLLLNGQEQGQYKILLVNGLGSILHSQTENLTSNQGQVRLSTSRPMAPGLYRIEVFGPKGYKAVCNLLITK